MTPLLGRVLIALATLAVLMVSLAPASFASSVSLEAGTGAARPDICNVGGMTNTDGNLLLPMNRWAESTTKMHDLQLSQDWVGNATNGIARQGVVANGLGTGNMMWQATIGLVGMSANMCPAASFGGAMDSVAAMVGQAVVGSPVITAVLVVLIVSVAWSFARRGGVQNKGGVISKLVALGLLAAMVFGAQASTGGGTFGERNDDAPYNPGVMSPGWVVTTMNTIVGSVASVPAQQLNIANSVQDSAGGSKDKNLSCSIYMGTMHDGYRDAYGKGMERMSAGLPLTISNMWEVTALQAWRTAQFGPGITVSDKGPIDDSVWCRMLEWNADVPLTSGDARANSQGAIGPSVESLMRNSLIEADGPAFNPDALSSQAFQPVTQEEIDRSAIAWGVCDLKPDRQGFAEGDWTIDQRFEDHESRSVLDGGITWDKYDPEDCLKWWTLGAGDGEKKDTMGDFEWPTTSGEVHEIAPGNKSVSTFINTLHGTDNSASVPAMNAYLIASVAILLSFGLMAIGLIVAKFVMLLTILGLFVAVVMVLLPGGSWSKVAGVFKVLLGVMIYAWCIQFLMSLVAFLTNVLVNFGNSIFGVGSTFHIFWVGLAPLAAILLLHLLFTKGLKMASPFSINGAIAWGQKMGGAGAAAMSGLSSLSGAGRVARDQAGKTRDAFSKGSKSGGQSGLDPNNPNGSPIQRNADGMIGGGAGGVGTRRGQLNPHQWSPGEKSSQSSAGGEGRVQSVDANGAGGGNAPAREKVGAGVSGANQGLANATAAMAGGGATTVGLMGQTEKRDTGSGVDIDSVEAQGAAEGVAQREDQDTEGAAGSGEQQVLADGQAEDGSRDGFDPDMLVHSNLANSRLGKGGLSQVGAGRMNGDERRQLKAAAKAERALATEWDNARREQMGLPARSGNKAVNFWRHRVADAQQGVHNATRNIAANPLGSVTGGYQRVRGNLRKNLTKGALVGTAALATGVAAPALLPALAVGLGAMKVRQLARKDRLTDRKAMDAMVTDYRATRREEIKRQRNAGRGSAAAPSAAASTGQRVGAPVTVPASGSSSGTGAGTRPAERDLLKEGVNAVKSGARHVFTAGPTVNRDILAASKVKNSELGKGKHSQFGNRDTTFWERRKVNHLARGERRQAVAWENQRRASEGLAPVAPRDSSAALKASVNRSAQKMAEVGRDIRRGDANALANHAANATATGAKAATVVAGVSAASLLGPAGVPLAVGVLGAAGMRGSRKKFNAERSSEMDEIVGRYRQNHLDQARAASSAARRSGQSPVVPQKPNREPRVQVSTGTSPG